MFLLPINHNIKGIGYHILLFVVIKSLMIINNVILVWKIDIAIRNVLIRVVSVEILKLRWRKNVIIFGDVVMAVELFNLVGLLLQIGKI